MNRKAGLRVFLLLLLLGTCICCKYSDEGDVVNKKRLTGRYVYQSNNQDTIEVNSDGTYVNYFWWEGKRLKNLGTWSHDSLEGRVRFNNFSFLLDSLRGVWITNIKTEGNEIHFIYATDIYKGYFLRVDSVDRKAFE